MLNWLRKILSTKSPQQRKAPTREEAVSKLRWIEADESSYGLRMLDCRPFTQGLMSVTASDEEVERFKKLCQSDGSEYSGVIPANAGHIDCRLVYPYGREESPADGPVFVAKAMEDKWNVYLFEQHLYFVRSLDGRLVFRAKGEFSESEVVVSGIEVDGADGSDADLVIAQVDYLIKSYIYNCGVPHPLPRDLPGDEEGIALYSFQMYGRRAVFATFEDPTVIDIDQL